MRKYCCNPLSYWSYKWAVWPQPVRFTYQPNNGDRWVTSITKVTYQLLSSQVGPCIGTNPSQSASPLVFFIGKLVPTDTSSPSLEVFFASELDVGHVYKDETISLFFLCLSMLVAQKRFIQSVHAVHVWILKVAYLVYRGVSILDCFVDIELCQKVSLWQTLLGNSISDVQTKQSWIWTSWMQLEFNIIKQKANREEYLLFFSSKLSKIFSTTRRRAFFVYSLLCSPGGLAISFYLFSFKIV